MKWLISFLKAVKQLWMLPTGENDHSLAHTQRKNLLLPLYLSSFLWPWELRVISSPFLHELGWTKRREIPLLPQEQLLLPITSTICIISKESSLLFSFQGAPIFHADSTSMPHVESSRPTASYSDKTIAESLLNRSRWRGVPLPTHFSFGTFWMFSLWYWAWGVPLYSLLVVSSTIWCKVIRRKTEQDNLLSSVFWARE